MKGTELFVTLCLLQWYIAATDDISGSTSDEYLLYNNLSSYPYEFEDGNIGPWNKEYPNISLLIRCNKDNCCQTPSRCCFKGFFCCYRSNTITVKFPPIVKECKDITYEKSV